jgi:hypothetical protein
MCITSLLKIIKIRYISSKSIFLYLLSLIKKDSRMNKYVIELEEICLIILFYFILRYFPRGSHLVV